MCGPKPMNIIAALDTRGGIGRGNDLPWHLPKEYRHFQQTTTKCRQPGKRNAVIMGRRCWDSIPVKFRPLKGRLNVVLSRTLTPEALEAQEGSDKYGNEVIVAGSLDKALSLLTDTRGTYAAEIETIWNVGGREVYALGLGHPWLHRLLLTRILDKDFDCDVFFPEMSNFDERFQPAERVSDNNEGECVNITEEKDGTRWQLTSYVSKNSLFANDSE